MNLSNRIDHWLLRDTHSTFYERIDAVAAGQSLHKHLPQPQRYAKTLRHILDSISVVIQPGEQIVGSVREIIPDKEQIDFAESLTREWWDRPDEEIIQDCPFWYSRNWLRRRPPWFLSFGHLGLFWEDILALGLGGMRSRAARTRDALAGEAEKAMFLDGVIECYDAISSFIGRYGTLAHDLAEAEADEHERLRLFRITQSLTAVQTGAPASFRDAVQLIWIITLVLQKICGCGVLNFGRLDQTLLPFFQETMRTGHASEAEMRAILEEFFFKNNEIMAMTDHMSLETEGTDFTLEVTFDDPNYLTVGGRLADGTSGVNPLSRLMVEAAHRLKLRNPFMVVRRHDGIDGGFMRSVAAAMRDNATLVIYNDETMLPALREAGVDEADAINYGFFGCNDPDLSGKNGGLRQLWWNLARPLELALNRGDCPMRPRSGGTAAESQFSVLDRVTGLMRGPYYGEETPDPDTLASMEEFIELYRRQTIFLLKEYRRRFEKDFARERKRFGGNLRIEDCFLDGTVENATTWTLGGVKYHFIITQGTGLATVVDSFHAIEELVFRNREVTFGELAAILAADWKGYEDLRERLWNSRNKFGNDIPEVDKYAKTVVDVFCDCVREVNSPECLYKLIPTLSSDRDFTTMGSFVGATPDGRRQGEKLSENQSPCEGRDVSGLTALFNSLAAVPFRRIAGGPLNVKIHPGAVAGEDGLGNLCALFKTYFENGGMQIQANFLDRDQLVQAKLHPEQHRSLCIRVTGYSAFFVQMGEKAQDELIARTIQL